MYTTPDDSNLDRCRCGVPARLIAELDLITYMHGTRSRRRTPIWNSTMESPLKFDRAHQTWSTHGNLLVGLPGDGPPSCTLGPSPTRGTHMPFSAFSRALSAEFNNNCPCCEPGCYQATTRKCMEGLVMLNADSF